MLSATRTLSAVPDTSAPSGRSPGIASTSKRASVSTAAAAIQAAGSQQHYHAPHHQQQQHGKVDDFIGTSIAGATMLGQLRRLMLRYRAMMTPRHVTDVLLAMERISSGRRPQDGAGAPQLPTPRTSGLRSVRVQPAQPPASSLNLESHGAERQVIMAIMGDLGNMMWGHLDEIDPAGLANCIWCWARLSWHPEPELLTAVARRFLQRAALDAVGPTALVKGIWGLSALEALGGAELAAALPRIRAAAPQMDIQQLRAMARALGAAAAAAREGAAPGGGGGGGAGPGGDGGGDDVAALLAELNERAESMRAAGAGRGGGGGGGGVGAAQ